MTRPSSTLPAVELQSCLADFEVQGHVGGGNGPSISQTGGETIFGSGSTIVATFGMSVTGGNFSIMSLDAHPGATIVGDFTFAGNELRFYLTPWKGQLVVDGHVTWSGGTYVPTVNGAQEGQASLWQATKTFTSRAERPPFSAY